jgi:RND family efflux transporter MFP subunit
MKRAKTIIIVAVFVLAGGGFFLKDRISAADNASGTRGPGSGEKAALGFAADVKTSAEPAATADAPFPTAKVEVIEEDSSLPLTGSLAADEKSEIAPNISGIVAKVLVDRGSVVEKGDMLVKIDPRDAQNMLAEGKAGVEELKAALGMSDTKAPYKIEDHPGVKMAKAGLDLAEANFKRYSGLHEKGAISKAAFDQAQTEYDSAKQRHQQALYQARQLYQSYQTALAKLNLLKKGVEDTTIVAPFSGWVADKYVSEGERVSTMPGTAGGKVVSLVKLDPLRLVLTVPQQSISLIKPGQEVKFNVDSFPDKTYTGEIRYVGPSLESNSRSLMVEAVVPNPDRTLRPGFFVTAKLTLPEKAKRILVPVAAVAKVGEVAKVYVVRDGKAKEQIVSLGETDHERVYVASGLTGGETVITAPWRVHDGDVVH